VVEGRWRDHTLCIIEGRNWTRGRHNDPRWHGRGNAQWIRMTRGGTGGSRTTQNDSTALILQDPAPSGSRIARSPFVAAMSAPRPLGSIDRVLREASAALGPLAPAVEAMAPPVAAPFDVSQDQVGNPKRMV
jgi:hypothetical protein